MIWKSEYFFAALPQRCAEGLRPSDSITLIYLLSRNTYTLLLFELSHISDQSFDLGVRIFLAERGHTLAPVGD